MNKEKISKGIVITIISFISGFYLYFDELAKFNLGKEKFLEKESSTFDFIYGHHPKIITIILTFIIIFFLFLLYEFIVYLITNLINKLFKSKKDK